MKELTQAQTLLDKNFPNQFNVIPIEKRSLALQVFEDKMASALLTGRNKGNIQFCEAGIARLYMTEIMGISEDEISKAYRKAELRVEKIRARGNY